MLKRTRSAEGDHRVQAFGDPYLQRVLGGEEDAARHLRGHGLDHGGRAVPEQRRSLAEDVVDVLVAVHVPQA